MCGIWLSSLFIWENKDTLNFFDAIFDMISLYVGWLVFSMILLLFTYYIVPYFSVSKYMSLISEDMKTLELKYSSNTYLKMFANIQSKTEQILFRHTWVDKWSLATPPKLCIWRLYILKEDVTLYVHRYRKENWPKTSNEILILIQIDNMDKIFD